jgi:BMFP domain-containing protein YqiC
MMFLIIKQRKENSMTDKEKIRKEVERLQKELVKEKEKGFGSDVDDACILELQNVLTYIDSLQEEPVSNDLEEVATKYAQDKYLPVQTWQAFKAGAQWQKNYICFAGRTKTIEEIKEALLSEVLPCFMHGGEADEVIAKLDEVLNQKKNKL